MFVDETLLLQRLLAKEDARLSRNKSFLHDWMERTTMGFVCLLGADSDVYDKPYSPDLIAIKRHQGHHLATSALADFLVRFWRRTVLRDTKVGSVDSGDWFNR
jgi:hypothetical protein